MNVIEKRDFIHSHLHEVKEPEITNIYDRIRLLLEDSILEESEAEIAQGNLTSHESLKQEIQRWRSAK